MDEGWWESVLAEEERRSSRTASLPAKPSRAAPAKLPGQRSAKNDRLIKPEKREKISHLENAAPIVDWDYVKWLFDNDEIIRLNVTGFNRGGLVVEGKGLLGFVPISHLVGLTGDDTTDREQVLSAYLGRSLALKVIECIPEEGRLVLSERAAQVGPGCRSKIFETLEPGQTAKGTVTNITDFGVFVDLGGVEGLIHISELSWGRVMHPGQIVHLGQEANVLVLEVIPERCRVALSLKRLFPNPWLLFGREFHLNQVLLATVTEVLSYGAFARLDIGIEGLIHVSEIPLKDGQSVRDVLYEGQRLQVRILHVDVARQRMGLSLRLNVPTDGCNRV